MSEQLKEYVRDIKLKKISDEENRNLFGLLEEGDESAFNKIVEGNLLTVYNIAWHEHEKNMDVPIEDLIQAGNEELVAHAVVRYKPDGPASFTTYLYSTIKYAIWDEVKKIRCMVDYGSSMPFGGNKAVVSLDELKETAGDSFEDEALQIIENPEVKMLQEQSERELEDRLDSLEENERYVINCLYRNDGSMPQNYREISKSIKKTENDVKRIELIAKKKLRSQYE